MTMENSEKPFVQLSLRIATLFFLVAFLGGCSQLKSTFTFTSSEDIDKELPAKSLAIQGMDDYNVGKYFTAIEFFEEILTRYPFSPEATLAELKAADCSYHLKRYQEAAILYEEFENHHPTNESIPYVMFQKAMCSYKTIDRIDRDPSGATKAIQLFEQLLKAYPKSPYTGDAQARISSATEFLANHEYFVAQYYVRTEKYDQAIIRLQYLLATYPETEIKDKAGHLLKRIEAGDPPKSRLWAWFPKLSMPDWSFFANDEEENSPAGEFQH